MKNPDRQNETPIFDRVKPLSLRWMIYLGKNAPFVRQLIHAIISIALRLFFRRIEAVNVENVPPDGAIIFVLNHPNGLVDPALVFVSLPRRVSFLAKSTLYDTTFGSFILKTFEILPIFRRIDTDAKSQSNAVTFDNCFELLERGRCIAVFPEGVSHDDTKLLPIKTGAARIALGAAQIIKDKNEASKAENLSSPLKILPVGLYYTSKTAFRSEVLIRYGAAFEVEPVAMDENGEPPRPAVYALNARIEKALRASL